MKLCVCGLGRIKYTRVGVKENSPLYLKISQDIFSKNMRGVSELKKLKIKLQKLSLAKYGHLFCLVVHCSQIHRCEAFFTPTNLDYSLVGCLWQAKYNGTRKLKTQHSLTVLTFLVWL